ncbi:MAG: aspartate transaminase aat1 [Chaenotheca gracillima]|nr:MAG: aspartate transaminase aat1 [Chaenotheca gracillima]
MADAISIEETNKIRVALGLKALPVPGGGPVFKESSKDKDSAEAEDDPGSTLESRQAEGYGNWQKAQEEADAKAKREAKNAAIKRARDAAQRFAKLEGKGLGDEGGEETDTKTWLIQQKKRQKKLEKARKLEKELAEREQQAEYGSADLAGVKVGHEMGDFGEGDEQVLTLKDTTIDENEEEGDELENMDLRERERLAERTELKKKKPVYDPNNLEDGEDTVLSHYDEVIDGKRRKKFTLDGQGNIADPNETLKDGPKNRLLVNLDSLVNDPVSDYVEPKEVKMRKPKKKKTKSTRQRAADEDDILPPVETPSVGLDDPATMDVDSPATNNVTNGVTNGTKKRSFEDASFVDDDELQASIALQRRNALKKRKKMRPEDIARQMREEVSATPGAVDANGEEQNDEEDGGLVIDETSEFVANLQKPAPREERRRPTPKPVTAMSPQIDDGGDVDMDRSYNDVDDESDLKERITRDTSTPAVPDMTSTGLTDETTLNQGIGATLSMLSQRGLIKNSSSGDQNALHRERQRFLAEKQQREADGERRARLQRERDRASGKLDRMSAREKEAYAQQENKQRDQFASRQMAEIFNREYKPDIDIKYTDEYGRSMNQKEAFKHLSHQFHGKGSGKQKTEKRLKKIDDEKRREAMSSLDSSETTGMNNAMGMTARKNRQAGVRLG